MKQCDLNSSSFESMTNYHCVIPSTIAWYTILVKVQNGHGEVNIEQVGKLLLEISVRELHQDLMKDPPTGFTYTFL